MTTDKDASSHSTRSSLKCSSNSRCASSKRLAVLIIAVQLDANCGCIVNNLLSFPLTAVSLGSCSVGPRREAKTVIADGVSDADCKAIKVNVLKAQRTYSPQPGFVCRNIAFRACA